MKNSASSEQFIDYQFRKLQNKTESKKSKSTQMKQISCFSEHF